MIVERIIAAAQREATDRSAPRLSAWNSGQCVRKLWYVAHNVLGEPLDARAVLRFRLGNLVEDAVCHSIAGLPDMDWLRTDKRDDNLDVPGLGIRARSDGLFTCPEDLQLGGKTALESGDIAIVAYTETPPVKGEIVGTEIKSMSNFAFERAQKGQLDDSYLAQIECGIRALGVRWWCCIAVRAETYHHCEVWVCRDDKRWQAVQKNIVAARSMEAAPARPYLLDDLCLGAKTGACVAGKTPGRGQPHKACGGTGLNPLGKMIPSYPCGYCQFKSPTCWGELELVFQEGKPRWRVK